MKTNLVSLFSRHRPRLSRAILLILLVILAFPPMVEASGSLTSVKDTLTNNRPSVATPITGAVTAGDTNITVGSTLGIEQGDTINICVAQASCNGGTSETKVVASVPSLTVLSLTLGTANSYTTSGYVYLKITSKHTVTFTTRSTVSAGSFVLTLASAANPATTTPASTGFILNGMSTTTDVSVSGFTAATTATSTSSNNLIFTFTYTGSLASNTAITLTLGSTTNMLNPTKTAASGTADTFSFEVDQKDNSGNIVDTTSGKVGTIEAVTVSATVSPSLTFTINPVTAGNVGLGYNTDQASTATSVPFGTLPINATTTVAQYINIATNSNSGYTVTTQQDGSLRKSNGTVIQDFDASVTQNNETASGFGYSLNNKVGSDAAFIFSTSGTFDGRGFSSTTPFAIMSNSGPVNGNQVYVLYRVKVLATQAQGSYQNLITYIATAIY